MKKEIDIFFIMQTYISSKCVLFQVICVLFFCLNRRVVSSELQMLGSLSVEAAGLRGSVFRGKIISVLLCIIWFVVSFSVRSKSVSNGNMSVTELKYSLCRYYRCVYFNVAR